MEPADGNRSSNEMVIRIAPASGRIVVEEHKPNKIVSYKEISAEDLYYALYSGYVSRNFINSGFLPDSCLGVSLSSLERIYYLWNPELRADISYQDTEYSDFPIPRLVFGVRMLETGKIAECSIGVVADEKPTPETPMYFYPFSNVYSDGKVCTGNNIMPRYRDLRKLWQFPRYLLGLPDNDDFYDVHHNRMELNHKELLEHLKDKDPSYYYTDVLVPNGLTLQQFMNRR